MASRRRNRPLSAAVNALQRSNGFEGVGVTGHGPSEIV
jgi:hypothetical protein